MILCAFFVRSPDVSTVLMRYYLLGGNTVALSRLYARLCHAFLVYNKLVLEAQQKLQVLELLENLQYS